MTIFVQLDLMKQYKFDQICSIYAKRMTMSKIDFDVRWDQALLSASEIPTDMVLEGLYKSKMQDSVQLQTVLALYEQETFRNNGQPSCSRSKTSARRHIDQTMRSQNFRVRSKIVERGAVTRSQKGTNAYVEGKVGDCFQSGKQMDHVRKETHVVSVMILYLETDVEAQRQKRQASSPASNAKAQTDGQTPSKRSGSRGESPSDASGRIPCRDW